MTVPSLSIINALYVSKNFENLHAFVNSSVDELKLKAKLGERKAKKIWKFLNDLA